MTASTLPRWSTTARSADPAPRSGIQPGRLVVDRLPQLAGTRARRRTSCCAGARCPPATVDVVVHLHGHSAQRPAHEPGPGHRAAQRPGPRRPGASGDRRSAPADTAGAAARPLLRRAVRPRATASRRCRAGGACRAGRRRAAALHRRHRGARDPRPVDPHRPLRRRLGPDGDPPAHSTPTRCTPSTRCTATRPADRLGAAAPGRRARRAARAVPPWRAHSGQQPAGRGAPSRAASPRFRVEQTTVPHMAIPRTYGWRLLADAGADLPGATRPARHGAPTRSSGRRSRPAARQRVVRGDRPGRPRAVPPVAAGRRTRADGDLARGESDPARVLPRRASAPTVTDAQMQSTSFQAAHPWSAVFVSYVMRTAGAGPRVRATRPRTRPTSGRRDATG